MEINKTFRLSKEFEKARYAIDKGDLTLIRICDSLEEAMEHKRFVLKELFDLPYWWHAAHNESEQTEYGAVALEKVFYDDFTTDRKLIEAKLQEGFSQAKISYSPKYEAYLVDERKNPIPIC